MNIDRYIEVGDRNSNSEVRRYFLSYFFGAGISIDYVLCRIPLSSVFVAILSLPVALWVIAASQHWTEQNEYLRKRGLQVSCIFTKFSFYCLLTALVLPLLFLNTSTRMHQHLYANEWNITVLYVVIVALVTAGAVTTKINT